MIDLDFDYDWVPSGYPNNLPAEDPPDFEERRQAFLRDYTALVAKHGILIAWCGCCHLWLDLVGEK